MKIPGRLRSIPTILRVGARPVATMRDMFRPGLRRAFPRYWRRRRELFATGGAVVVVAAVIGGVLVHWLIPIVVIAPFAAEAARLAWRGRSSWGRNRSWPSGSVGVGSEPMMRFDHFARESRRHGPVFKSNYFATPMVCVTDLDVATQVFRESAADLGHRPLGYDRHIPGGAIRWASEPRHTQLRQLFARAMPPSLVNAWRPRFSHVTTELLTTGSGTDVDPRRPAREAARQCCSGVLLGFTATDPAYSDVRTRMGRLDICRAQPVSDDEAHDHLEALSALIRDRVRRGQPADPGSIAARLEADHPGILDDDGVMRNLIYLALGPRDDVAGLMTWVCWYLADHPSWLERVRTASSDSRADMAGRIVSETLRLDQSEYVMRTALNDIHVGDDVIPAGWFVRVCVREIHRDPQNFDEPTRFDPDRFVGATPRGYAPLGIDHHSCIGASLARAIAEEFVIALAEGFDLRVVADGPREFSVNGHWAPSPNFRVALSPLDPVV